MNNDPYSPQPPQGPMGPHTQYPGQVPPPSSIPPGYPPPSPYYQMPMQPPIQPQPPKKSKKGLIITSIIIGVAIVFCAIIATAGNSNTATKVTTTSTDSSNSSSSGSRQRAPSQPQTWQTTHTYSGNGAKKTEIITVGNDWKLQWTCDPTSSFGGQYNVIVSVTNADGTPNDPAAVNTICKAGNVSGETEEHSGGNIYLDVNSEAAWTLTVQELK